MVYLGNQMKAKELIEKLKAIPEDTLVLVDGYEDGYSNIGSVASICATYDESAPDYIGPYQEDSKGKVKAFVLRREARPS